MNMFSKRRTFGSAKIMSHLLVMFCLGLILQSFAPQAKAQAGTWVIDCNPLSSGTMAGPNGITVDPNQDPSIPLWTGSYTPTGGNGNQAYISGGNCYGTNNNYSPYVVAQGQGAYLGNNMYDSGIPGIGVKITLSNPCFSPLVLPSGCFGYWYPGNWKTGIVTGTVTVQLFKVGAITGSGTLNPIVANFGPGDTPGVMAKVLGVLKWSGSVVVNVSTPSCTVANQLVKLPTTSSASFGAVGSENSEAREPFNIALTCSGGSAGASVKADMVITDKNNPSNTSDILPIDPSSTGSGVGVRIYNQTSGATVKFGPDSKTVGATNQFFATTVQSGNNTYNLPFSATYVKTANNITPGTVVAYATVTLAYE